MATDFRALCAELLIALENAISIIYYEGGTKHISTAKPIVNRARAALADEPAVPEGREPVAVTGQLSAAELLQRQALVPVPVSERLPGPEDCDADGRCWWWHPSHPESSYLEGWMLRPSSWGVGHYDFDDSVIHTHWLPAHALPQPEAK